MFVKGVKKFRSAIHHIISKHLKDNDANNCIFYEPAVAYDIVSDIQLRHKIILSIGTVSKTLLKNPIFLNFAIFMILDGCI